MQRVLIASAVLTAFAGSAAAANCPPATKADMMGVPAGTYPLQYDLAEFQQLADCELTFTGNPDAAVLNARITGNPALPDVAERLPDEPLVIIPYQTIGAHGGVLDGLSNATEAGTSDLMSVRHVNLVSFSDDLVTIVPNVASSWQWNDDFTELSLTLRRGHKWSDGAPFTAHDIAFWYNDITLDTNIVEKPRDVWLSGGVPMAVEAVDDLTVRFTMPAPRPGLLATFATDFAQPFQPRHFLGRFHPAHNPDADALAQAAGFESGYEVIKFYYGGSDWKDVPTAYLKDPDRIPLLPAAVVPTLESHIIAGDSTEGRQSVANPYFHMVDTAGNQLPYINEISEIYVADNEVRILKMVNGEVDYKSQSVTLPDAPTLLDGQEAGNYTVDLRPQIGLASFSFNVTSADPVKREVFGNRDFRLAMSHAIDRAEINSVAYFDLGTPQQYVAFDPVPPFATAEQVAYATEFDPELARSLLDAVGVVDADGDGWRDLPNGDPLKINIQFSTQGLATSVAELVAQHWSNVGVETSLKEITSDEYRSAQSANELDVMTFTKGQPIPVIQGDAKLFVPPFGDYFGHRNAMLWANWIETDGTEGIEPPPWVAELRDKLFAWQQLTPGTPESNALGRELIQAQLDAFLFIGTVLAPNPVYHSNDLVNFEPPKTWSYEYYRVYPYRPQQWSLAN